MNWEFRAVHTTDAAKMIREYAALAEEAIDNWLLTHVEPKEKQEEAWVEEFPSGFARDESKHPFAYRFRFRVGYYNKGGYVSLDPPEYDVTVQQTFHPQRSKTGESGLPHTRVRYIDNVPPIC